MSYHRDDHRLPPIRECRRCEKAFECRPGDGSLCPQCIEEQQPTRKEGDYGNPIDRDLD